VGESYYLPMTSYLDTKTTVGEGKLDLPGPLSFSERIACNALSDRSSVSLSTQIQQCLCINFSLLVPAYK
jgi:hypothetical protein